MPPVVLPTPARRRVAQAGGIDAVGLAAALRERVRGGVRFDDGTRALYATDASNYRQVPIGVVVPRTLDDVAATVQTCREFGAPVLSRGGGTSLAGECCNVAVVIDFSKHLTRVESIDADTRTAVVQPGIVLDQLNAQTRPHGGLVFGPKPATHSHCTIGGMIGNNSCGSTAQWSGTTAANVHRLEILTYDGTRMWVGATSDNDFAEALRAGGRRADLYRRVRDLRDAHSDAIRGFPRLPRRISGYNLPALLPEHGFHLAQALVGSEATCVTVLRAELALLPEPAHTATVLLGYPDIVAAARAVEEINQHQPYVLEGFDDKMIAAERHQHLHPDGLRLLPDGKGWLLVQFGADTSDDALGRADDLVAALRRADHTPAITVLDDAGRQAQAMAVRESALGATAHMPNAPDAWPGWEDSAVPPDKLGDYLDDLRALQDRFGYGTASIYGHFGHGCVHTRIPFQLTTVDGVRDFRAFVEQAADLVVSYGGSLSGEHGDGQARGELLARMYGADMVAVFEKFRAIFDPDNRMNPGKVVHANPLDADLRLGPDYAPDHPDTYFRFLPDGGNFAAATTRCVGVGNCRRPDPAAGGGVMCPSYQATRDEQHSTRGRARLLFEMLRGDTITDGWRSPAVAEALDLCLACKGCKSDCPVSVDMATYKAEFLAHHYTGRLRPRDHYSLGWLPAAALAGSAVPGVANTLTHAPVLSGLTKRLAGVDPRRQLPSFAAARFVRWFHRRPPGGTGRRGAVLLWPDTFTTHFAPGIAAAAVGALEAAGFRVQMPSTPVCCGLTWISTGQLGVARRVLRRSLDVLGPYLRAGLPVVGLEPSCTAVFRSDAADLLGPQVDLDRLGTQTKTFAELLGERAPDFAPHLTGGPLKAVVQAHCHQHAILGSTADTDLMARIGLDATVLDSGCCGLAGNFGMTANHRDVSLACAERVLLPAVRRADPETLVLADGFSCRTQIEDAWTGRRAVHLAEVVNAAVRGTPIGDHPEDAISPRRSTRRSGKAIRYVRY